MLTKSHRNAKIKIFNTLMYVTYHIIKYLLTLTSASSPKYRDSAASQDSIKDNANQ